MKADELRIEYNKRYSRKRFDKWSVHRLNRAIAIVNQILHHIAKYGFQFSNQARALDVGCAKGHITEALRLNGFEAFGLDYSDVAINLARDNFPGCIFKHMNGINPRFNNVFDLIISRGFSGTNTHDLNFVADFSNKYVDLLCKGGFYILSYSSDFSGYEEKGETVCWSFKEIECLSKKIKAIKKDIFIFPKNTFIYNSSKKIIKQILGRKHKKFFYIIYKKDS